MQERFALEEAREKLEKTLDAETQHLLNIADELVDSKLLKF